VSCQGSQRSLRYLLRSALVVRRRPGVRWHRAFAPSPVAVGHPAIPESLPGLCGILRKFTADGAYRPLCFRPPVHPVLHKGAWDVIECKTRYGQLSGLPYEVPDPSLYTPARLQARRETAPAPAQARRWPRWRPSPRQTKRSVDIRPAAAPPARLLLIGWVSLSSVKTKSAPPAVTRSAARTDPCSRIRPPDLRGS
jgi:hypothetical protein